MTSLEQTLENAQESMESHLQIGVIERLKRKTNTSNEGIHPKQFGYVDVTKLFINSNVLFVIYLLFVIGIIFHRGQEVMTMLDPKE